jgi:hypothetical protein
MARSLLIACCVLVWTACSKNSDDDKDKLVPTVDIWYPDNNHVFAGSQTIGITGTILDDTKVAEMHVHIYNNTTAALLIDIHRYPDVNYYLIDESFQAQPGIQYKIQIIGVDKTGKQGTQSVLVSCN